VLVGVGVVLLFLLHGSLGLLQTSHDEQAGVKETIVHSHERKKEHVSYKIDQTSWAIMKYQQDELSIPVNSVGKASLLGAVKLVTYYTQKNRAEGLKSRPKQS